MTAWLAALRQLQEQGEAAVLVTVAEVQGSTPREAGARMVYGAERQYDTIGGGHLEWRAGQIARAMLAAAGMQPASQRRLERIALGPSLGQCCGGTVLLCFERIDAASTLSWQMLESHWRAGDDLWRAVPLEQAGPMRLYRTDGRPCSPDGPDGPHDPDGHAGSSGDGDVTEGPDAAQLHGASRTHVARDTGGRRWLLDLCRAHRPQVVLFGAGHVGAAIVQVLSRLPCRILWVDEREDMFPAPLPPQVTIEATDAPNVAVDLAEPGAYYLVMTHSHALDQQLTERILKREDIGWFGLIGSHTKRKQFEHRLTARGYRQAQLDRITCPIGIAGIDGKEPASIAIAVAAQLLQLWEARPAQAARDQSPPALATHALDGRG